MDSFVFITISSSVSAFLNPSERKVTLRIPKAVASKFKAQLDKIPLDGVVAFHWYSSANLSFIYDRMLMFGIFFSELDRDASAHILWRMGSAETNVEAIQVVSPVSNLYSEVFRCRCVFP